MWRQIKASGEIPPERHSSTLVSDGEKLILFGGTRAGLAFNDVHILDIQKEIWSRIETTGSVPSPRWGAVATLHENKLFLYGGDSVDGVCSEVCMLDISTRLWITPSATGSVPPPRSYHAATAAGNRMYVHGGDGPAPDPNFYSLSLEPSGLIWERLQCSGFLPEPRRKHSLAHFQNKLYVFGGVALARHQYMDDLYVLDVPAKHCEEHKRAGAVPPPRGGHACQVLGGRLFIHGGVGGAGNVPFAEVHHMDLDGGGWFKRRGSGQIPPASSLHASAVIGGMMAIFGGVDGSGSPLNGTYVLDVSGIY